MKYLCTQTCQVRIAGKITLVKKGRVVELTEEEAKDSADVLVSVEAREETFDALTASEEELLAVKWSFTDVAKLYKTKYNVDIVKKEDKADIVKQLLDARHRSL